MLINVLFIGLLLTDSQQIQPLLPIVALGERYRAGIHYGVAVRQYYVVSTYVNDITAGSTCVS